MLTSFNITNRYYKEIINVILFGGLSLAFGRITEIGGGISNFRELPLLIYMFYLRIPWMILLTALIASIPTSAQGSFIQNFIIHYPGMLAVWGCYCLMEKTKISNIGKGLLWTLVTGLYYMGFLLPTWAFFFYDADKHSSFFYVYMNGLNQLNFELLATAFVTGLYLVQHEIRNNLRQNQLDLEKIVDERTKELAEANKNLLDANNELNISNQTIWSINENLDELVKQRSEKIEEQLKVLNQYADMNAHQVRAPLARMLGLMNLINMETNDAVKTALLEKLNICAIEMDDIIKKMNRLLEKEIIPRSICIDD